MLIPYEVCVYVRFLEIKSAVIFVMFTLCLFNENLKKQIQEEESRTCEIEVLTDNFLFMLRYQIHAITLPHSHIISHYRLKNLSCSVSDFLLTNLVSSSSVYDSSLVSLLPFLVS